MIRGRPLGTVVVLVVGLVAVAVWWTFFRGPSSQDCAPVRDLLAYNKSQVDAMNAKTEPGDLDFRGWADGLADRAAAVTEPELADRSKEVAQTVDRLVRARADLDAHSQPIAPGAGPPPAAMVVAGLNQQYEAQIARLAEACG
ncbi:hypothetical protein JRC04_26625 [Mycolicibacterium sp. S2-37]|uniref:hypothetical protein n=1 Tax=Mycolicibacterium sp. S2-37 TaxID=2810297 RepID=UPI001A94D5AC|nr:hypothetical protein [Mycolicibacterium sp. S2-37]MBO0681058.1 hypothetical protein [Mycolicibacterium sp. S2-37]